ncbi:hypothetical protein NEAUS04_2517, partial [Nematocida ausubeli]
MNSGAVVQITPKEHQIRTMIPGQMTKINTHKPIEEKLHQTERPEESLNLGAEFQNTPIEHQIRNMIKGQMTKINTQEPIRNTVYDLTLTSTKPIYLKGYPVPAHYEEVVDAQIKELLEQNIIEKGSRGDYISPGFIIGKKNGKHRLVVDYSSLNKITEEEGSIFPDVYQLLREIPPNQKLFTQIDLKHGYHQVLVAKSSRKYTGFTIRNQHYIYKRMPFGLKGAPAFFQRTIFDKIGDLPFVKIFLDDILIFSQTLEEHLQHIQLVLNRLAEHNIQLNFEKSHFLQRRVTYLGNILTEKGMQADTQKIAELRKEPPPKTARGIMKLLGIFNWFRPYIPNLSQTVQPLTEKLKGGKRQDIKNKPISWTEEDEKVRQKIFDAIEKQLIIANPDPKEPFQLYTDACDKGIGAILTQGNTLIGIFSKSLNPAQKNYTIMEKELLAVISALQYFRILILGRKIYLHTDNKNILARKPLDSSRSERWKIMTLEYDMEMRHIAGDKNLVADYLSRAENKTVQLATVMYTKRQKTLPEETQRDNVIQKVQKIEDPEERVEILSSFLGHPGSSKLYKTLQPHWKSKHLHKIVEEKRKKCESCQRNIIGKTLCQTKTLGHLSTSKPMKHICSDIFGPFVLPTDGKKRYLITITDRCTRWTQVYATKAITSHRVIKALQDWINTHGVPETVLHDQGLQYTSKTTKDYCKTQNIRQVNSTPYNPTGNSISERINQDIRFILSHNSQIKINQAVTQIHRRLNYTYHRIIECTPFELVYGYHPLDPDKTPIDVNDRLNKIKERIQKQEELSLKEQPDRREIN